MICSTDNFLFCAGMISMIAKGIIMRIQHYVFMSLGEFEPMYYVPLT